MTASKPRLLEGQKAIVTGASSGIGAAIAHEFAAAGATVGVNHHGDLAAVEAIVAAIREAGGEAMPLAADVAVEHEVDDMVRGFVEREGRLDILVANAGRQRDAAFAEMSLADWQRV